MYAIRLFSNLTNFKLMICMFFLEVTGVFNFINKYIFSDVSYLKWLVIVMILDFITGVTKVWVNEGLKAITSKGFRCTVSKVIQYASFLIVTHVLTHFQIEDRVNTNYAFLSKIAYEFLILIEIKSVYENIVRINPELNIEDYVRNKIINMLKKESSKN